MSDLPVSIRGRFKRSVDLTHDFHTAPNIGGYIVTPTARKVLGQVHESLTEERPERAWTLTGPYGGGKSTFALFAAHVMRGTPDAIEHLRSADEDLADGFEGHVEEPFCPVLVGGSRQPLCQALLRGLAESVERFVEDFDEDTEAASELKSIAVAARETTDDQEISDEATAELFAEAAEAVRELTSGGLFVVVDELGKMLEYAATRPEEGDIFILQLLAERASRTAGSDQAPLLFTTILHQAFKRYATHLDQVQRQEWQKVQGRFEDIAYVEPADATLRLLAEAIQVKGGESLVDAHGEVVSEVIEAANLPKRFDEDETEALLRQSLPLHPTIGLIVGPLFQRLAQNERSLFAFLAAEEPRGFLDVMRGGSEGDDPFPLYRLDHLYDYLLTTLGATLFNQDTSKLWAETEAAFGRLEDSTPLAEQLLKQIALLNFAGEMAGLTATTPLLKATVDAPAEEVEEELERLADERVVVYRSFNDSYRIWQGSDVDIEEEIEKARPQVPGDVSLAGLLREVLPPSPVAAYRHSYETGTTRTLDVMYASGSGWEDRLEDRREDADGHILYVLPESETDGNRLATELQQAAADPMLFVAVPDGVGTLRNTVFELKCIDWVGKEVDGGDKAARRELRERRTYLENRIDAQLNRLLVADEDGENPCQWFHDGDTFRIDGRGELQDRLSTACDVTFTKTPEIRNELLNLRQPSPSAVRAQKKLLEAMVIGNEEEERNPTEENLGIDGTPAEYGLYVSIVRSTGMHRETDDGTWAFFPPYEDENPGCCAVWQRIDERFEAADGRRVSLDEFFDVLTEPPYGVRQGLIPVFLFAYFKANEDEIAVYENGTILKEVDYGTIERLLKSPEKFEMQHVAIEGVREDVLRHLAPLVGLPENERKLLPVVLRLLRRVHGLPPFVSRTSRMSEEALAVRERLDRSNDPVMLLFDELPECLNIGIDSFLGKGEISEEKIRVFVRELRGKVREITNAYDDLIREIQRRMATAFEVRADEVEEQRQEIAERAQILDPYVTDEDDLKAFVIRATNEMMETKAWYESIAALLAGKPPLKWTDDDVDVFRTEVVEMARKFRNQETLIFEDDQEVEDEDERQEMRLHRIRLGITMLGEPEQETVVQIHPEDEEMIESIADRVYETLESDETAKDKDTQVKLAALGRLIQRLEDEREASMDAELDTKSGHE